MIKRLGTIAAALVLGAAGTGLAATQAWAGNVDSRGCVRVYVEYESINDTQRRVWWAEATNACSYSWSGHFELGKNNGPDRNPAPSHRVNLGGIIVNKGQYCVEGVAWRNDGAGKFFELGRVCTRVV